MDATRHPSIARPGHQLEVRNALLDERGDVRCNALQRPRCRPRQRTVPATDLRQAGHRIRSTSGRDQPWCPVDSQRVLGARAPCRCRPWPGAAQIFGSMRCPAEIDLAGWRLHNATNSPPWPVSDLWTDHMGNTGASLIRVNGSKILQRIVGQGLHHRDVRRRRRIRADEDGQAVRLRLAATSATIAPLAPGLFLNDRRHLKRRSPVVGHVARGWSVAEPVPNGTMIRERSGRKSRRPGCSTRRKGCCSGQDLPASHLRQRR